MHMLARMPDNQNIIRSIYSCCDCFALTPDYEGHQSWTTDDQVAFHERKLWAEVDEYALQQDLVNLRGLVASFEKYLGDPSFEKRVFEIGAGRGGLLKALLDAGYDAKGCEPATRLVDIARKYYNLNGDILSNVDVDCLLESSGESANYLAVIMWHVFEHLGDAIGVMTRAARLLQPQGFMIIQVPMLAKDYIFPGHYFFCTHKTFSVIAEKVGLGLFDLVYDDKNLYITAVFQEGVPSQEIPFLGYASTLDALSQTTLMFDRSRVAYRESASRLAQINFELHTAIDSFRSIVTDRDSTIMGWKMLAEDRLIAMEAMEKLIVDWKKLAEDRLTALGLMEEAYRGVVDDRDMSIAGWRNLAEHRLIAMNAMEELILAWKKIADERLTAIVAADDSSAIHRSDVQ